MSSLPDEEPLPTNVEEAEALIERHKRAILRISSHVNRFSSAAFVPDEILCEIFKLYATDSLENGVYPYEFIKLAHICRYWRAIVLGCASLWTHIKVVDSLNFPPFLRTMKDWSRNRPLTVSAVLKNNTKSKSPAALKILFTKVFDRIRELDIQAQDRNLPALFKFISQRGCLPMLRTFKIKRLPLTSRRPTSLADIVFPCWNELPALQNLVIDGYPLEVIRPLIPQSIRSLTFLQSEVGCRFGNLSTDMLPTLLFGILSATPVLEHLYFATSLGPSPLQRQVDLPRLKSLTVTSSINGSQLYLPIWIALEQVHIRCITYP
ncbi:hypothetical protein C8Q75DRAFT_321595 [Abortiporus biennis]|nr:hypothetical protein C8Q75DRAFT_321595 [Abortiporus biennis]